MPELPEAERARLILETAIGRRIVDAEDSDTYVCRPHAPGEIAAALRGHALATAERRGKFLWAATDDGPVLGLHLGMAGQLVLDPEDASGWDRFVLHFADGGRLALRDRRRLGRAVVNPNFGHVGPDAALVGRDDFRRLIGRGRAPVKARLLDQGAISGIGNLLADEVLWHARIAPGRRVSSLSVEELDRLRRSMRTVLRSAVRRPEGSRYGPFTAARDEGRPCPRDGRLLKRARIGGRTTFWCDACQE